MNKPKGYEYCLGEYGPQLFDALCGEPVMWGFEITRRVGDEVWKELSGLGYLECSYPNWYLITKKLTREEAIEKYGKITNEKFGPKGGWKSVMFGKKEFCSKVLKTSRFN